MDPPNSISTQGIPWFIYSILNIYNWTRNGDLPANAPLDPTGLPEDPAKANTDQAAQKDVAQMQGISCSAFQKSTSILKRNLLAANTQSRDLTRKQHVLVNLLVLTADVEALSAVAFRDQLLVVLELLDSRRQPRDAAAKLIMMRRRFDVPL
ncbi:beta-amyrin synthase-like [Dorcoceras hygrometricum]|uniref:Beta-amyrin synthase-like n=1 Tax=Dorcoceras hygrometricum TaxID=472368 RepID=A0A2Z7ACK1_9LAMI|nr:beta-amyrin synthase-like [Dorcoceras hygrometricum]